MTASQVTSCWTHAFFCLFGFDTGSCVFEASFELALQLKITWNFRPSCLCHLGFRITGMNRHTPVLVMRPGALCFLGRDSHLLLSKCLIILSYLRLFSYKTVYPDTLAFSILSICLPACSTVIGHIHKSTTPPPCLL